MSLRVLCLFSSAELARHSLLGGDGVHWTTELDQGPCEFVPLVVDGESAALAASGLFGGATVLCRPADLCPALADALRGAAEAFEQARIPLELVAIESPVTVLAWLAEQAPALTAACRQDGEVRLRSPSWWRERARRHLAAPADPAAVPAGGVEPEDLAAELAAFVAKRGW